MKHLLLVLALGGIVQSHGYELCGQQAPGSFVGSPTNCSEFYMCRSGRPVLFSCPYDMYFDVDTAACGREAFCAENDMIDEDLSAIGSGPGFIPILAEPSRLVPDNGVCEGFGPGTIRLDVKGCSGFYQCTKVGPLQLECPVGTLFDSNRLFCEVADLASCAFAPVIKPTQPPPALSIPSQKPPVGGGSGAIGSNVLDVLCFGKKNGQKFAHPTNCLQYFVCNGRNKAQLFTCPPGTAYHKAHKICDFAHNVSC